jgi:hypothetical protein
MFDDPDYRPRPARARPDRPAFAEQAGQGADPANRWAIHGDPMRLAAAAAALRAGNAEEIFGTRYPGEYVMTSVARLLEAIATKIRERADLGHDVVSAATELAEHALAYVPRDGGKAARTR